jgi:DNA-binding CsgD family transcriptional regulator
LSPEQREETEMLMQLTGVGWGKDNPAFRQVFTTLFIPEGTPEQRNWFNDLQRVSTSAENAVKFRRAFGNIEVTELAQKVNVPSLVLHARDDAVVPFESGRDTAALIPNARFVPMEGKNHLLLSDEPAWEHFLAEVRAFLGIDADPTTASLTGDAELLAELTEREVEVLDLIARGLTNEEIAQRLVISPKTVRNHITNIFSKLDVTHRSQAIVRAREVGLGAGGLDPL